MGQAEVHDFLEDREGEWFTPQEIAREIGLSPPNVLRSLRRLNAYEEIERRFSKSGNRGRNTVEFRLHKS